MKFQNWVCDNFQFIEGRLTRICIFLIGVWLLNCGILLLPLLWFEYLSTTQPNSLVREKCLIWLFNIMSKLSGTAVSIPFSVIQTQKYTYMSEGCIIYKLLIVRWQHIVYMYSSTVMSIIWGTASWRQNKTSCDKKIYNTNIWLDI